MEDTLVVILAGAIYSVIMFSAASTLKSGRDKNKILIPSILFIFIVAVVGLQVYDGLDEPMVSEWIIIVVSVISIWAGYNNGKLKCPTYVDY